MKSTNLVAWQKKALELDRAPSLLAGEGHSAGAPPFTRLQRLLMVASSLLYLSCAHAWQRYSFVWLARCFVLVSALSVGADSGTDVLPESVMRPLRVADRTVGTTGLLSSVLANSTSPLNTLLSVSAVLTSLLFLAKGRRVARADPRARWRYLGWHASWHAYGAAVLVATTVCAQS